MNNKNNRRTRPARHEQPPQVAGAEKRPVSYAKAGAALQAWQCPPDDKKKKTIKKKL